MKIYITDDSMCTTQKLNLARVQKWIEFNGSVVVDDIDAADKLFCMTCNGWSLLEEESYNRIKRYSSKFRDKMIVVGCVNDAHPEKVKLIWDGPTVRTNSLETHSFSEIESFFPEFKVKLSDIPAQSTFRRKEDYRDYNLSKRFINIAEGCAFNCTFCTHKPGLGRRRSRPLDEILKQIEECVRDDVKVINLMGMETSMWGVEFKNDYAGLLKSVLDFSNTYEVHIAQFNATGVNRNPEGLLPLFQNKRVTDIQAPVQTTSNRLLKMMNRKLHTGNMGDFLRDVRKKNTRVILRTDLIIGWPTETLEERISSLDFAGQYFDEVALYSIELSEDLPAWKYRKDAFSSSDLYKIHQESMSYMALKYPKVVIHSGQQADNTMEAAEKKRIDLRNERMRLV
jgi:tRNA A37 methylthiotransferase MiaB